MDRADLGQAVEKLRELADRSDLDVGNDKGALLLRARNLAAALLDPYVLFHTKIVVSLVRERSGDVIDEIAAWLHDIGRAVVDSGHREVGAAWAEQWLRQFYITDNDVNRMLDAIRNHGTRDKPTTKTGKLLKLVDALAAFDDGWVAMIAKYAEATGNDAPLMQLKKKLAVVKEPGDSGDLARIKDALERYGILEKVMGSGGG